METSEANVEAESEASRQLRASRRAWERYHQFLTDSTEDDYRFMKNNNLLGLIGETKEKLLERLQQIKVSALQEPGAYMGPYDYCETVEISGFEETKDTTESEQRAAPSWIPGNQNNSSSSDSGRPNSEQEYLFTRLLREYMENPQFKLTFAALSTAEESTTEAPVENLSTGTQRWRNKRRRKRKSRDENESCPTIINELAMRFRDSVSLKAFEQVSVNKTETFSRNKPRGTSTQQITRPVSQLRGDFPASEITNDFSEYSPSTTSNREFMELTRAIGIPNLQVTIFPRKDSPEDKRDSTSLVIPKTLYSCVTAESAQEELRDIVSRAEEAGIRGNVGTLRIPAFRSANAGLNDTRSVASQRKLRKRMTRFGGSSNIMDSNSDLQHSGLPPTQNMQSAESRKRRYNSNSNPNFEFHSSATATYNPGFDCITGSSFTPMFNASSRNKNPEITSRMFEYNNGRSASLGSPSQARQSQRASSEIPNKGASWLSFDKLDESIFNPNTGLTKRQIDNLPQRIFRKGEASKFCSVCATKYRVGSKIRTLPCSHEYHVHCIDSWLSHNTACPICHKKIIGYQGREDSKF